MRRKKNKKKRKFQFAETKVVWYEYPSEKIQGNKPNSTKKSEKCMRFDLVARDLNPFNEVSFGNTKTDLAIRPSTRRNKNSIFDVGFVLWTAHTGTIIISPRVGTPLSG